MNDLLISSAGIILYTFIQFHSTPAIVTSIFIGLGIIFCGCAMVHNVFVWQRVSLLLHTLPGIMRSSPRLVGSLLRRQVVRVTYPLAPLRLVVPCEGFCLRWVDE